MGLPAVNIFGTLRDAKAFVQRMNIENAGVMDI